METSQNTTQEEIMENSALDASQQRKSSRMRVKPRSFSPERQKPTKSKQKCSEKRRTKKDFKKVDEWANRPYDKLANGSPFSCDLCKSPFIIAREKQKQKPKKIPSPRLKVDHGTGKTLSLCNACGLAFDRPVKEKKVTKTLSDEDRNKYLVNAKDFSERLCIELNDQKAQILFCPECKKKLCGCLQAYIGAEDGYLTRAQELLSLWNTAKALSQLKCYSPLLDNEPKRKRKIGLGNGMKKSKKFEAFVIEKRKYLREEIKLCERATQKILCYSNNFIFKKLKSEEGCRIERSIGKAALGLLEDLEGLHLKHCCADGCVRIAMTHFNLLKEWRDRANQGQSEARRVLAEMLTPTGGSRPNCYNFISMVTGRSLSLIVSVNDQMRRTRGNRQPPVHGLKEYWQKKPKKKKGSEAEGVPVDGENFLANGHVYFDIQTNSPTSMESTSNQFDIQRQHLLQLKQQLAEKQSQISKITYNQQMLQQQLGQHLVQRQQLGQQGQFQQVQYQFGEDPNRQIPNQQQSGHQLVHPQFGQQQQQIGQQQYGQQQLEQHHMGQHLSRQNLDQDQFGQHGNQLDQHQLEQQQFEEQHGQFEQSHLEHHTAQQVEQQQINQVQLEQQQQQVIQHPKQLQEILLQPLSNCSQFLTSVSMTSDGSQTFLVPFSTDSFTSNSSISPTLATTGVNPSLVIPGTIQQQLITSQNDGRNVPVQIQNPTGVFAKQILIPLQSQSEVGLNRIPINVNILQAFEGQEVEQNINNVVLGEKNGDSHPTVKSVPSATISAPTQTSGGSNRSEIFPITLNKSHTMHKTNQPATIEIRDLKSTVQEVTSYSSLPGLSTSSNHVGANPLNPSTYCHRTQPLTLITQPINTHTCSSTLLASTKPPLATQPLSTTTQLLPASTQQAVTSATNDLVKTSHPISTVTPSLTTQVPTPIQMRKTQALNTKCTAAIIKPIDDIAQLQASTNILPADHNYSQSTRQSMESTISMGSRDRLNSSNAGKEDVEKNSSDSQSMMTLLQRTDCVLDKNLFHDSVNQMVTDNSEISDLHSLCIVNDKLACRSANLRPDNDQLEQKDSCSEDCDSASLTQRILPELDCLSTASSENMILDTEASDDLTICTDDMALNF